jgi:GABA(A) receptor-associated protein
MTLVFKQRYSLHHRCSESHRVIEKYPDKVPIICERANTANMECPNIDKNKYLVSRELTIGQFIYVIRKRMILQPEKAIFLFIEGIIPPSSHMLGNIYEFYKDNDGFLYITYSFENTFGKK